MKRVTEIISMTALASLMVVTAGGCDGSGVANPSSDSQDVTRPEGWTDETHGDDVEPNYEVVFPEDTVNRLTITIDPEDWEAMQTNMVELYGEPGTQGGLPGIELRPNRGGLLPDTGNMTGNLPFAPEGELPPGAGGFMPGAGNITRDISLPREGAFPEDGDLAPETGNLTPVQPFDPDARQQALPGWADMTPENPVWVTADIEFNGLIWTNVGVRYKGNSSLTRGWRSGSLKMPFKLDFDEFEDEYPEIDDQRFYGFKQLSLSNVFNDATYMHDVLAADILAEAGLPSATTAYYEVVLDYGEGPVDLGLYVMIEVIDDTAIERYFGEDSGNIYEGDGRGVSLAEGTYGQIKDSFLKENNEDEADWSDIEELYKVLHSEERTADPESWRESLEAVFDVNDFLEWLAIAAVIQHWDTYGSMTHNFYLYHDPDTDLLTWISWDHNEILSSGGMGGLRAGRLVAGVRPGSPSSLGREEVTELWPLIRYLLDDPVYYERYVDYIEATINGPFDPVVIEEKIHTLAELVEPYAAEEIGASAFEAKVQQMIDRVYERYEAASEFLASGG